MKLGASYNLFDAEELLEKSILSIKPNCDFICVVYQKTSNWGNKCNPHLVEFLEDLKVRGLVDELVLYEPKIYSIEEKKKMVSVTCTEADLGGPIDCVSDVFFNELAKRELGRLKCQENGCTHYISMDTDEFYLPDQMKAAKQKIIEQDLDATACRMRLFFKDPIYEYLPPDDLIKQESPFRLAARYPVLLDPTRRVENPKMFFLFPRSELEMYHMSFVRKNIRLKLDNVSNKGNYGDVDSFIHRFQQWQPAQGVLHPHPFIGKMFKEVATVDNLFDIDLNQQCRVCCKSQNLKRCSRCKSVRYCSSQCQKEDWDSHKYVCKIN